MLSIPITSAEKFNSTACEKNKIVFCAISSLGNAVEEEKIPAIPSVISGFARFGPKHLYFYVRICGDDDVAYIFSLSSCNFFRKKTGKSSTETCIVFWTFMSLKNASVEESGDLCLML